MQLCVVPHSNLHPQPVHGARRNLISRRIKVPPETADLLASLALGFDPSAGWLPTTSAVTDGDRR